MSDLDVHSSLPRWYLYDYMCVELAHSLFINFNEKIIFFNVIFIEMLCYGNIRMFEDLPNHYTSQTNENNEKTVPTTLFLKDSTSKQKVDLKIVIMPFMG